MDGRLQDSPNTVDPSFEFAELNIQEALELAIRFIDASLLRAEEQSSPSTVSSTVSDGVKDDHRRQIEVCIKRFRVKTLPEVSIGDYLKRSPGSY